jgi:hypothetical protein
MKKRNQLNQTIRHLRDDLNKHLKLTSPSSAETESFRSKISSALNRRHPIASTCQKNQLLQLRLERQRADLKNIIYDGNKLLQMNHLNTREEVAAAAKDSIDGLNGLYDIDKFNVKPILDVLESNGRLGVGGCDDGHVYTKVSSYMGGRQALRFVEHFDIQVNNKFAPLSCIFINWH